MTLDRQPTLVGERLTLRPLRDDDFDALYAVASDPKIWAQHPEPTRWQEPVFRHFFAEAIASGGALAAIDNASGAVIGSSRYHDYDPDRSVVEIGWSFLARNYWGGRYNGEMKRLMLDHAFRSVDRVVFVIGPDNTRSRRAVERIGARLVGTAPEPRSHLLYEIRKEPPVSTATLAHYDANAASFWEGTRDHDVQQNIDALLRHIESESPYRILDLGCGPGRDLATFKSLGHEPVGLDGSPKFAAMAREHTGCEVWVQNFLELDLPSDHFDGVFANASLFHVPTRDLARVLRELRTTLKPGGVLFASNPRGNDDEGWHGGRYGVYHTLESWRAFLTAAGFTDLEHYYRPTGLPREQQSWLATVWRRS